MKSIYKYYLIFGASLLTLSACKKNFLDRQPNVTQASAPIPGSKIWTDKALAAGVLSSFYAQLPSHSFGGKSSMTVTDEALSGGSATANNTFNAYSNQIGFDNQWNQYYTRIRNINLALFNLTTITGGDVLPSDRKLFIAELRYMRAEIYFDFVKQVGGVPIITELQVYDFSGDPTYLQKPRNTEAEVYDFINSEVDAIAADLIPNNASKSRVNQYGALALKSRAMLYAGSIAQFNTALTPTVSLAGGEVGIPASKAVDYYQKSFAASQLILNSGVYSLYESNPNLGENFFDMYSKKSGNPEVIWARDYLIPGSGHNFSYDNIARSIREDNLSSSATSPSLNLVEAFEYTNRPAGSSGELLGTGNGTAASQANWIFYAKQQDIFANKDARLYGNIAYPGELMKGASLDIQAGIYTWDGTKYVSATGALGSTHTDGGRLTGLGGPQGNVNEVSPTGFYLRKLIDPVIGSSNRGVTNTLWWVRYRLGETYLNAAEAAFQLDVLGAPGTTGGKTKAAEYLSRLRQRAGFAPNSITAANITLPIVQNERRVELCFEDHRLWDIKRWRIAHTIFNGSRTTPSANVYALFGYRISRPGHPDHNKFVYDKFIAPRNTNARNWLLQNYYAFIDQSVRDNNPKIKLNPFQQ